METFLSPKNSNKKKKKKKNTTKQKRSAGHRKVSFISTIYLVKKRYNKNNYFSCCS